MNSFVILRVQLHQSIDARDCHEALTFIWFNLEQTKYVCRFDTYVNEKLDMDYKECTVPKFVFWKNAIDMYVHHRYFDGKLISKLFGGLYDQCVLKKKTSVQFSTKNIKSTDFTNRKNFKCTRVLKSDINEVISTYTRKRGIIFSVISARERDDNEPNLKIKLITQSTKSFLNNKTKRSLNMKSKWNQLRIYFSSRYLYSDSSSSETLKKAMEYFDIIDMNWLYVKNVTDNLFLIFPCGAEHVKIFHM